MVFEIEEIVKVRSPSYLKWHFAKVIGVMGGGQCYLMRYVMVDESVVVSPQRIRRPLYGALHCAIFCMHESMQHPELVNCQWRCFKNEGDRAAGGF
eukprot:15333083-Ditylum_brightwellii.AAC.1